MKKEIDKIMSEASDRILDAELDVVAAVREILTYGGVPMEIAKHYLAYREAGRRWMLLKDDRSLDGKSIRIYNNRQLICDVKQIEGIISDYTKAPWRESKKELPEHSGMRCICFVPSLGCEVEMIFHRSRPDSGYKDYFTECAKGCRAYDWDFIKYWRYYTDTI